MLPSNESLLAAAHTCYSLKFANEVENRGGSFGPGAEITEHVPELPAIVQLPIILRYIGRIEEAWGQDIGLVFHHMQLEPGSEAEEQALTDLLLGCMGEGISLADRYSEHLARASAILGKTFDEAPTYFEGSEWFDLAMDNCPLEPVEE